FVVVNGVQHSLSDLGVTVLPSVTDLVVDPFNSNDVWIGLGNIGLVNVTGANWAGLWKSVNAVDSVTPQWNLITGGDNKQVLHNFLRGGVNNPGGHDGSTVGRVTIAEGSGRGPDEAYVYVLIGNPPPSTQTPGSYNLGTGFQGNTSPKPGPSIGTAGL